MLGEEEGKMKILKKIVITSAVIVFAICFYSFLVGNEVFEGKFENDAIAWYFLAKGIFCSLSLFLFYKIVELLSSKQSNSNT